VAIRHAPITDQPTMTVIIAQVGIGVCRADQPNANLDGFTFGSNGAVEASQNIWTRNG
jgi:hypothetical protein